MTLIAKTSDGRWKVMNEAGKVTSSLHDRFGVEADGALDRPRPEKLFRWLAL